MICRFTLKPVLLVTSAILAAMLFAQDVISADHELQLEAIPLVLIAHRTSSVNRLTDDRSKIALGTLEYDRVQRFHPEDPAVLTLNCEPVERLGVWYVLYRKKRRATPRTYTPTFNWSFKDGAEAVVVDEHTHSTHFSSHFAGGQKQFLNLEYLQLSESLKRDGVFDLVVLLEGQELFSASFGLQGCKSDE